MELESILKIEDRETRYREAYDYICDYFDNKMRENNYCDFIDGKCIANRLNKSVNNVDGCCYNRKEGLCHHLVNGVCQNRNVSCKLFMCEYLEKQGVKFALEEVDITKRVFNKKQIRKLKKYYFKEKNEVIKKLLDYS